MTHKFTFIEELRTPEVKSFEKRYSEQTGRQVALRDIPIKNFVDVSTGLLETKVASLFLKGASDEGGFWPELISVVQMTAPVEDVPIVSSRDIKIRRGKMPRTEPQQSGGKYRKVRLDTTNEDKIRYAYLPIDTEDVKLRRFDVIEKTITAAGQAFARSILDEILKHYVSKAGNSQALGVDKYFVAVMKAIGLNKADGFGCSAIVIDQNDFLQAVTEETAGGTMPWLLTLNGMPLGDNFGRGVGSDGQFGKLFSRIPTYSVANNTDLSGNILCIDGPAAAAFGFAPGGQVELAQEIRKIEDVVENKISAKFDFASPDDDGAGKSNAIAKVTGA